MALGSNALTGAYRTRTPQETLSMCPACTTCPTAEAAARKAPAPQHRGSSRDLGGQSHCSCRVEAYRCEYHIIKVHGFGVSFIFRGLDVDSVRAVISMASWTI